MSILDGAIYSCPSHWGGRIERVAYGFLGVGGSPWVSNLFNCESGGSREKEAYRSGQAYG